MFEEAELGHSVEKAAYEAAEPSLDRKSVV